MKRLLITVGILLACTGLVWADEPPVVNDPSGFYQKAKELIDRVDPRGGAFFNIKNHTWLGITEAKLLSVDVKGYTLDGTFGYGVDQTVVLGAETDVLAGLSHLTGATLHIPWFQVNAGLACGYSIEDDALAYGPVLNASVKW